MKWLKRQFGFGAALLALSVLCWMLGSSWWALAGAGWDMNRVSFRASGEGFTPAQVRELRRQIALSGDGRATGWAQALSAQIELDTTRDSTAIDVIWLDGDAADIMNPRMLRGQMPAQGDHIGCALDEETALRLFGSLDIVGSGVRIDGQDMTIRGVYAFPTASALAQPGRGLAFCPAALWEDAKLNALELHTWFDGGGKTPTELAGHLLSLAAMGTDGEFDDYADARSGMALMTVLPGNLLALMALLELLACLLRMSRASLSAAVAVRGDRLSPPAALRRVLGGWLAGALALLGAAAFILFQVRFAGAVPPSFLPTRWSDFAFWPGLVKTLVQSLAQARLGAALRPDMLFGALLALSFGLCLCSVLLILWARRALARGVNYPSWAQCAALTIPALLALPLGLWLQAHLRLPLGFTQGMLLLPVGYLGIFLLTRRVGFPPSKRAPAPLLYRGFTDSTRAYQLLEKEG